MSSPCRRSPARHCPIPTFRRWNGRSSGSRGSTRCGPSARPGRVRRFWNWLAGRVNPELANPQLEALRRIAVLSWHYGFTVAGEDVADFLSAGFSPANMSCWSPASPRPPVRPSSADRSEVFGLMLLRKNEFQESSGTGRRSLVSQIRQPAAIRAALVLLSVSRPDRHRLLAVRGRQAGGGGHAAGRGHGRDAAAAHDHRI